MSWGRRILPFTIVEGLTRDALAIEVGASLTGGRLVRVLEWLVAEYSAPDKIVLDNGPELASDAADQ